MISPSVNPPMASTSPASSASKPDVIGAATSISSKTTPDAKTGRAAIALSEVGEETKFERRESSSGALVEDDVKAGEGKGGSFLTLPAAGTSAGDIVGNLASTSLDCQYAQSFDIFGDGDGEVSDDCGDDEVLIGTSAEDTIIKNLFSLDSNRQQEGAEALAKLLAPELDGPQDPSIIQMVIFEREAPVVPRLASFLERHDNPELQLEATKALSNIAEGTEEHAQAMVDHGTIPAFVGLLKSSPDGDVRDTAAYALAVLARRSASIRDAIIEARGMPPLLELLDRPLNGVEASLLRNATFALKHLCGGDPSPALFGVTNEVLENIGFNLPKLFVGGDETLQALADVCHALVSLTDVPLNVQKGAAAGFRTAALEAMSPTLVELLGPGIPVLVQLPALRVVRQVLVDQFFVVQEFVLESGRAIKAVPCLHELLWSPHAGIRTEACWAVANILRFGVDIGAIGAAVINAERPDWQRQPTTLMGKLVELSSTFGGEEDVLVREKAARGVAVATRDLEPVEFQPHRVARDCHRLEDLVDRGCINSLCNVLGSPDSGLVAAALEGLVICLSFCDWYYHLPRHPLGKDDPKGRAHGLHKIPLLAATHEDPQVRSSAKKIVDAFGKRFQELQAPARLTKKAE